MSEQIKESKNGDLTLFNDASKFAVIEVESSTPLSNAVKEHVSSIILKIFQTLKDEVSSEPLILSFDAQNKESRFVVKTSIKKIQ